MSEERPKIDLRSLLGPLLINNQGSVPVTSLEDCVVGLYFSAHWCPPCRQFTPKLKEVYKAVKATGKQFEVIFVSSDQSATQFEEYFATMPWLALPFANRAEAAATAERFGIRGIPALVIIDRNGKVINANARGAVMKDAPGGSQFPWAGQQDPEGYGGPNWKLMLLLIVGYYLLRFYFKVI
ncbi:probable Nucleoredoxin [Coccomyxa sp. Obi]|nr:probable Nucleoredoxin [Coccomyxa sp. Obi]